MITGLNQEEQHDFELLTYQLDQQQERNQERWTYYTAEQKFKNMGISVDKEFEPYVTTLGWCGKAVRSLANRIKFDGFVAPDSADYYTGMDEQLAATSFFSQFNQAKETMLVYGCGFMVFTKGNENHGEPAGIARGFSARDATGILDTRVPNKLRVGLTVSRRSLEGNVLGYVLYYSDRYVSLNRDKALGTWTVTKVTNPTEAVSMTPMTYRPALDKPWGQSRITRPMMGIVDGAIRTNLRSEVNGEFYSYPMMVALNMKPEDLNFKSRMGKAFAVDYERDKTGRPVKDAPEAKIFQLETSTTLPNLEQLKHAALNFSAEAAMSPDKLGVVYDNPSSADAIDRADAELNLEAEVAGGDLKSVLIESIYQLDMIARGAKQPREELKGISADLRDPGMITRYSQKLAAAQLIGAGALPPGEAITYEIAGMTPIQVKRLVAAYRRSSARQSLSNSRNERVTNTLAERGEGDA